MAVIRGASIAIQALPIIIGRGINLLNGLDRSWEGGLTPGICLTPEMSIS
jgi:hypothetical protein